MQPLEKDKADDMHSFNKSDFDSNYTISLFLSSLN